MFEIYKAYKGRKSYVVVLDENLASAQTYAKKYFKCSTAHIVCVIGYIYRNELYFQDPQKRGTRACWIAYYKG